jgi:hypothetical protein
MSFHYSPRIVQDGLVLYLDAANTKSYPTTGTTWSDLSRRGNNGTLTNGPTFNSLNGGGIVFDGVNDYVSFQKTLTEIGLINQSANTFECWVQFNSLTNYMHIIDGSGNCFHLAVEPVADGRSMFFWNGSSYQPSSNPVATTLQWFHLVGVQESSFNKVYANGVLLTNGSVSSNATNLSMSGGKYLALGYWQGFNNRYLNGILSQVRLYNRALSAQEVLQNYNATKSRFGL